MWIKSRKSYETSRVALSDEYYYYKNNNNNLYSMIMNNLVITNSPCKL